MTSQIKILIADRERFLSCVEQRPEKFDGRTFMSCVQYLADYYGSKFTELRLFKDRAPLTMEFNCICLADERSMVGVIHWDDVSKAFGIHT